MRRENAVWVAPSATSFSCLCETCLEISRAEGGSFLDAVRTASVRGRLAAEALVGFVHCSAGHQVLVRRIDTPVRIGRRDTRQLQIV